MNARDMTRRSLLAVSAGALAGAVTRPGSVLAALTRPQSGTTPSHPSLREQWVGLLGPRARTIALDLPADLIGVRWQGTARAGIELRFRTEDGGWSRWAAAGERGHGPEGGAAAGGLPVGDPVWTGGARAVQVRASQALSGARLVLVDVSGGVGARRQARLPGALASAAALAQALPVLAAGPPPPPPHPRGAGGPGGG